MPGVAPRAASTRSTSDCGRSGYLVRRSARAVHRTARPRTHRVSQVRRMNDTCVRRAKWHTWRPLALTPWSCTVDGAQDRLDPALCTSKLAQGSLWSPRFSAGTFNDQLPHRRSHGDARHPSFRALLVSYLPVRCMLGVGICGDTPKEAFGAAIWLWWRVWRIAPLRMASITPSNSPVEAIWPFGS
jgi:hypothetical protein